MNGNSIKAVFKMFVKPRSHSCFCLKKCIHYHPETALFSPRLSFSGSGSGTMSGHNDGSEPGARPEIVKLNYSRQHFSSLSPGRPGSNLPDLTFLFAGRCT